MMLAARGVAKAIGKAICYVKFYTRSHDAVIRVYDDAGNVIETHEHRGVFKYAVKQCELPARSDQLRT